LQYYSFFMTEMDDNINRVIIGMAILASLLFLIPYIFFLYTQQQTLKSIREENRLMRPGQVWLQLIPLFQVVYQFIVVGKIADSIQKELSSSMAFSFEDHAAPSGYQGTERPSYSIGLAYCILFAVAALPLELLRGMSGLACLVCWIVYWVQITKYKNQIKEKNYSMGIQQ
jgi:hypothetical protein